VPRRYREFLYALVVIAAVTALYVVAYVNATTFPDASGLVGHGIGIAGFVLMLMTATLYSLRKLRTDARWGSTAAWLRFHMVTGLVGPYMVLLHTAMRFSGLAGVAMLLTVVVTASGLIGRYIYTRVPRVAAGVAVGLAPAPAGLAAASTGPAPATAGAAGGQAVVSGGPPQDGLLLRRRKALATWRSIHVPLTWVLFAVAFVHIVAALYYATLRR
jgi:hypothetical protein